MLTKIYLAVLTIFIIPMVFLTLYAGSWLHSIGNPKAAVAEYTYYSGMGWTVLWIAFAVLAIMANVILWKTRKAWALWLSFLYFAVFIFLRYWWLEGDYLDFAMRNGLTDSTFSTGPLIASILVVGVGMLIFFDQFVVLRLADRMHPVAEDREKIGSEEPIDQEKAKE